MNYYTLKLEIFLNKNKPSEKDFCKVVNKFFNKLFKLTKVESSEEKLGFNIAKRSIIIDITKVAEEKSFIKLHKNSARLQEALVYISKYIYYEECERVGTLYANSNNMTINLFAYKDNIFLSTIENEEDQKVQTVTSLKGGEVSFKISNEIEEIPLEINVVLAHMSLERN